MKKSYIFLAVLIIVIISGCANSEKFEPIKPEESLEHLNFLKSAEQITVAKYDKDNWPTNPYLITDDANEIEKLVSTFTNKKGEVILKSDRLSKVHYQISFDSATIDNDRSGDVVALYDYDKNLLMLHFKHGSRIEEEKRKYILVHSSKNLKKL